jgi:phosphoenolpyruvate carboxykinase (GTP)
LIFIGFGENSRVLEWIFKRAGGEDVADVTPIGHVPKKGSLNIEGLGDIDMEELFSIPKEYWLEELQQLRKYWDEQVGEDLPTAIMDECKALEERLKAS